MDEPERMYPLTYDLKREDPPLPAGIVKARGRSACDAIVFLSMIYPEDGSFSLLVESLDGRKPGHERVSEQDLFKCWFMVGIRLSKSLPQGWRRDLCEKVAQRVREHVMGH
jgi:hypothetical protein